MASLIMQNIGLLFTIRKYYSVHVLEVYRQIFMINMIVDYSLKYPGFFVKDKSPKSSYFYI